MKTIGYAAHSPESALAPWHFEHHELCADDVLIEILFCAKTLGAHKVLISTDEKMMSKSASSFDLIIGTVPVKHDINPYVPLLDIDGTLVIDMASLEI